MKKVLVCILLIFHSNLKGDVVMNKNCPAWIGIFLELSMEDYSSEKNAILIDTIAEIGELSKLRAEEDIQLKRSLSFLIKKGAAKHEDVMVAKKKGRNLKSLLSELSSSFGFNVYVTSVGVVFCSPEDQPFPNFKNKTGVVWAKIESK